MLKLRLRRFFLFIILFSVIPLNAESVFLKSGVIYQGAIIKENDSSVVVRLKDRTEIKIPRSNIIRILMNDNYSKLQYMRKMDGEILEIYLVDEDSDYYTYRTELESPDEYRIAKEDVDGITKKRPGTEENAEDALSANVQIASGQEGGYTISAGGGIPYGMAGFQYSYYFKIFPFFTTAPYASTGVIYPFIKSGSVPFSFGSMFTYGTRHRVYLNLAYSIYPDSDSEGWHIFSGSAGYEFCSDSGLIFRVEIGPAYKITSVKREIFPVLPAVGIGFKF